MKHLVLGFSILALACAVLAAPFETTCDGYCVGPVKISCPEAGNWSFTATRGTAADGVETMEIALTASRPSPPTRRALLLREIRITFRERLFLWEQLSRSPLSRAG